MITMSTAVNSPHPAWLAAMELILDILFIAHGLSLVLWPRIYDQPHRIWNTTYYKWSIGKRKLLGWFLIPIGAFFLWFSCVPKIFPSIGLTPRSSRTPPALPSGLPQHFANSALFIVSVQAWPLSFFR